MTQDFEIIYAEEMDKAYSAIIWDAFNKDAREKKGLTGDLKSFSFSCLDQDKNFIAGMQGISLWGGVYITSLFVDENHRNKKYGRMLMEKAEELARERGCNFVALSTMDFQAKPFYEKLGYKLEFTRHGYEKDSVSYQLRKDL
ncbi:MAG TPA: GNAT family N-acetyltransferase [Rickettsia endosymbiont of Bembidion nr. Transversale]|nr:GNAT family N-acetyltransferase [Rickettsia endosymbiont of Stiretrus anchorago]HJD66201.1 GNAT family N-acetyltransferase [Rickettsia endosymbiont of Bembidion nr. Transversale]